MAALIKEAKQRARRRRWITSGGAAVLVTIAAVVGFAILPVSPSPPESAARNVPSQTPSPVGSPLDHGIKKQKQEVTRRCNSAVFLTGPEGREVLVRGDDGAVVPVAPMPIPQPVGAVTDRGRTVIVSPEIVAEQAPSVVIRWADHQRVCRRVRGETQGK